MKKIAVFAFNGDPMCFVHVALYRRRLSGHNILSPSNTGLTALKFPSLIVC